MSDNSSIEWTDASWSPITGCTRVSPGCDHCYSAALSKRLAAMGQKKYQGIVGKGHFNGVVKTWYDELSKPLNWKKPKMIFVNSMSDTFHKDVPFEFIDQIFLTIERTPWHTYQILTKRPDRMAEYTTRHVRELYDNALTMAQLAHVWPLPNVWLGTSVEDQQRADERIPWLLKCPASVRFLSCEPLLSAVDLQSLPDPLNEPGWKFDCLRPYRWRECRPSGFVDDPTWNDGRPRIDWVIVGGESGHGARPCNINWIRSISQQCAAAGVACFVKQLGSRPLAHASMTSPKFTEGGPNTIPWRITDRKGGDINEFPDDLKVRQFPTTAVPQ